jgi:hypothetical protein
MELAGQEQIIETMLSDKAKSAVAGFLIFESGERFIQVYD